MNKIIFLNLGKIISCFLDKEMKQNLEKIIKNCEIIFVVLIIITNIFSVFLIHLLLTLKSLALDIKHLLMVDLDIVRIIWMFILMFYSLKK